LTQGHGVQVIAFNTPKDPAWRGAGDRIQAAAVLARKLQRADQVIE
jgi:hypothetical protein